MVFLLTHAGIIHRRVTCDNQQQATSIPSLPLCSVKPSEDYSLAPDASIACYAVWCLTIVSDADAGERRNEFAAWTDLTHLFWVRRSNHLPSSRPSSTTTSDRTAWETSINLTSQPLTIFPGHTDHYWTYVHCCVRVLGAAVVVRVTSSGPRGATAPVYSFGCGLWFVWFSFYTSHLRWRAGVCNKDGLWRMVCGVQTLRARGSRLSKLLSAGNNRSSCWLHG